ncbi:MAG: 3-oxo-5a-steroid 4- dehydrogenase [Peltula sp. TS41687]|nr:MAG: 3-oxo-5a-steroid 4- dehydrogenase [Peltula sp. TS41687]
MSSNARTITLAIRPRGTPIRTLPASTLVSLDDSTQDLYKRLAHATRLSPHRLRITKGSDGTVLPNNNPTTGSTTTTTTTIESTRLRDQSIIYVKDLGPQISWRTVFALEYLGPLLIHPLFYFGGLRLLRPWIYGHGGWWGADGGVKMTTQQTVSFTLVMLHFLKRELETFAVHRFSAATMPLSNLFKNSAHYWLLAGVNLAYWTYRPLTTSSSTSSSSSSSLTYLAITLFLVSETLNFLTHMRLRSLRPAGSTKRAIPHGLGFDTVTCPNYAYEMLAWVAVWIVNWRMSFWATGLFVGIATAQMAVWARKKEGAYRRQFGGVYGAKRWGMVPGVV